MERRRLYGPVLTILLLALALQTVRARDLLRASRELRMAQEVGQRFSGPRDERALRTNLLLLRDAAGRDPVNVEMPLARGSSYLLLGDAQNALASYREAEALEPRAEVYMNLGHAYRLAGDLQNARRNYDLAVKLDLRLTAQVPADVR